jgi:Polyketide cyclase / dehydrase and lipid transport
MQLFGVPTLRQEGLDFLKTAPVILEFAAHVRAPQSTVWSVIGADPTTWTPWFPGLREGAFTSPPPYGVGTKRQVKVRGVGRYKETIVAWDEGSRMAYRVDSTSLPIARALLEDWVLEPDGADATTVHWTFAIDPTPIFRVSMRLSPNTIGGVFRKAMHNLDARLAS